MRAVVLLAVKIAVVVASTIKMRDPPEGIPTCLDADGSDISAWLRSKGCDNTEMTQNFQYDNMTGHIHVAVTSCCDWFQTCPIPPCCLAQTNDGSAESLIVAECARKEPSTVWNYNKATGTLSTPMKGRPAGCLAADLEGRTKGCNPDDKHCWNVLLRPCPSSIKPDPDVQWDIEMVS